MVRCDLGAACAFFTFRLAALTCLVVAMDVVLLVPADRRQLRRWSGQSFRTTVRRQRTVLASTRRSQRRRHPAAALLCRPHTSVRRPPTASAAWPARRAARP